MYGLAHEPGYPKRCLLSFAPINLEAANEKQIEISVGLMPLQRWVSREFVAKSREVTIKFAASPGDKNALRTDIDLS